MFWNGKHLSVVLNFKIKWRKPQKKYIVAFLKATIVSISAVRKF